MEEFFKKIRTRGLTDAEMQQMWSGIRIAHQKQVMTSTPSVASETQKRVSSLKKIITAGIIFALSGATAYASNAALPGDVLYPLDRAIESVQLGLTSGETEQKIRIQIVEERMSEITLLTERLNREMAPPGLHASSSDATDVAIVRNRERSTDANIKHISEGFNAAIQTIEGFEEAVLLQEDGEIMLLVNRLNQQLKQIRSVRAGNTGSQVRVEQKNSGGKIRIRIETREEDEDENDQVKDQDEFEIHQGKIRIRTNQKSEDATQKDKDESRKDEDDHDGGVEKSQSESAERAAGQKGKKRDSARDGYIYQDNPAMNEDDAANEGGEPEDDATEKRNKTTATQQDSDGAFDEDSQVEDQNNEDRMQSSEVKEGEAVDHGASTSEEGGGNRGSANNIQSAGEKTLGSGESPSQATTMIGEDLAAIPKEIEVEIKDTQTDVRVHFEDREEQFSLYTTHREDIIFEIAIRYDLDASVVQELVSMEE